ncbi:MAG TPA: polysaccharide biosynthesis tyrosine autokinase [Vicinamibacterales bacterium]|nr:polysaccharide biosynthesis tyrosine autokinase [Vicinamibacterales bacterium]
MDHEPRLLDYLRVLSKRRWIAASAFVVTLTGTGLYVLTAPSRYEGRVEILIEPENPNVVSFKEVVDADQARADYYQTQYKLLQSRELARTTIDALRLWNDAEFGAGAEAHGLARLWAWMRSATGPSQSSAAGDESPAQARTIDAFLDRLDVSPVRNSRLVDVSFRSLDARLAARIANEVARGYINQSLQFKFLSSKQASDWLGDQLKEQRAKLEQTEAALQHYLEQNDALSLDQRQDIVVQKLADLNAAVTRAKTERIQKEAVYHQLQEFERTPAALDTFPSILTNAFIQQQKTDVSALQQQLALMSEKFGAKHPDVVKTKAAIELAQGKLRVEVQKVASAVRAEYETAKVQEDNLVAALDQQKIEALAMNRKGIQYAVLQRDAESNRQLYNNLLQRAKETGVSSELKTINIRVVDPAKTPVAPASPKRLLDMLAGFGAALCAGIGLAFVFEYLDNRVKTPDEIRECLGIAPLGMIPTGERAAEDAREPLIDGEVNASFSEAFRTVRTNVLFSSAEAGARSIAVTSTGPHEGKTMVASNLAIGFAQAGQRVALVDADMRRPRVHEVFGLPQEPGLSNAMVGATATRDAMRATSVDGLFVLPAGRIPPNPAELLGSARFRDLLDALSADFDWIVVDTPPVMAVTDASVVGHAVSGVVFVVSAQSTNRSGAKAALDQLERARATLVGAVLNRVDFEGNAYYYSQYYRKEYARYYVSVA